MSDQDPHLFFLKRIPSETTEQQVWTQLKEFFSPKAPPALSRETTGALVLPPPWFLSVSHTEDTLGIALSHFPIGIDLLHTKRASTAHRVRFRISQPSDHILIQHLNPLESALFFTGKEACVKAHSIQHHRPVLLNEVSLIAPPSNLATYFQVDSERYIVNSHFFNKDLIVSIARLESAPQRPLNFP